MTLNLFNKSKLLNALLAIICLLVLYHIYTYHFNSYLFTTDSIRAFLGVIAMIIAINTRKISKNKTFTFLAIAIGCVSILEFSSILFNYYNDFEMLPSHNLYAKVFGGYLKVFALILTFKLYNKVFNFKPIIYLYCFLIIAFILLLFVFKVFPSIFTTVLFNFNISDILRLLLFLLSLYSIYVFLKYKQCFNPNDTNTLMLLSCLYSVSILIFYIDGILYSSNILRFSANLCLVIHIWLIYKIVIQSVLVRPHNKLSFSLINRSDELEKSLNLYKSLVDSLPKCVLITKNNKVLFANKTAICLFKYDSKKDLHNKYITQMIPLKLIKSFIENSKESKSVFETKFKESNGEVFDAEVSQVDVLFDDSLCTLNLIKDITERKKIEELSLELKHKAEEDKLKQEFFANLSHELRTPINFIYSTLQLEDIYIKNQNMDGIEKHHHMLKQNCFRLLKMCNNLIDVTRIDSDYFNPHMNPHNIVEVIENIASTVYHHLNIDDMRIVFDTEVEETYILCDKDLIERTMLNLISNSLKHGGIDCNIYINIYDQDDNIKIVFKDDGPGIPDYKSKDLFKKFVQTSKCLARKDSTNGLGLALVKSIVDLHDGSISFKNNSDFGCEFTILLPKPVDINIDEVAISSDFAVDYDNNVDKINIEFSDLYL